MKKDLPKLLVIVGPTASGKTALAVRLAKVLDGEIVSADSRLLYKGMDIGTAKPKRDVSRAKPRGAKRFTGRPFLSGGVSHHLIDVVSPEKTLTLAEYKKKALRVIRGILKRGKLPILAGGTGLYVRAIVDNFDIPEVPPNPRLRRRLERLSDAALFSVLRKRDPDYAARAGKNRRYAIRALEAIAATGKSFSAQQKTGVPLFDVLQIGLNPGKGELHRRIGRRARAMFRNGLVAEAVRLARRYPNAPVSMSGIGYAEALGYVRGDFPLVEAVSRLDARTRQYAKRQLTWFKRDPRIVWIDVPHLSLKLAKKWLSSA